MANTDMRCDQCEAAMINGVYCHETGCPNKNKVKIDDRWVDCNDECDECEYEPDQCPEIDHYTGEDLPIVTREDGIIANITTVEAEYDRAMRYEKIEYDASQRKWCPVCGHAKIEQRRPTFQECEDEGTTEWLGKLVEEFSCALVMVDGEIVGGCMGDTPYITYTPEYETTSISTLIIDGSYLLMASVTADTLRDAVEAAEEISKHLTYLGEYINGDT